MALHVRLNLQAIMFLSGIIGLVLTFKLALLTIYVTQEDLQIARYEIDYLRKLEKNIRVLPAEPKDPAPAGMDVQLQRTLDDLRTRIENTYNITVVMYNTDAIERAGFSAQTYSPRELQRHLKSVYRWLQKYPPNYTQTIGLETLYLLHDWHMNGVATAGFLIDRYSLGMQASERVLHHELYHLADIADGGIDNENEDWILAKYGEYKPHEVIENGSQLRVLAEGLDQQERPYGFASAYGKYGGIEEDQATTAEELLTRTGLVYKWATDDLPLAHALDFVEKQYNDWSDRKMNGAYWRKLLNGDEITAAYWAK